MSLSYGMPLPLPPLSPPPGQERQAALKITHLSYDMLSSPRSVSKPGPPSPFRAMVLSMPPGPGSPRNHVPPPGPPPGPPPPATAPARMSECVRAGAKGGLRDCRRTRGGATMTGVWCMFLWLMCMWPVRARAAGQGGRSAAAGTQPRSCQAMLVSWRRQSVGQDHQRISDRSFLWR